MPWDKHGNRKTSALYKKRSAFKMNRSGFNFGEGTGSALKKKSALKAADPALMQGAYQQSLGGTTAEGFGKGGSFVKDALPGILKEADTIVSMITGKPSSGEDGDGEGDGEGDDE